MQNGDIQQGVLYLSGDAPLGWLERYRAHKAHEIFIDLDPAPGQTEPRKLLDVMRAALSLRAELIKTMTQISDPASAQPVVIGPVPAADLATAASLQKMGLRTTALNFGAYLTGKTLDQFTAARIVAAENQRA